ncbi:MAG: hypothetical protein ACRDNZ_01855 [Streptosporangiaceae bacterium]
MNTAEPDHERCRATLESASLAIITPRSSSRKCATCSSSVGVHQAAHDFLEDVAGGFCELAAPSAEDYTMLAYGQAHLRAWSD